MVRNSLEIRSRKDYKAVTSVPEDGLSGPTEEAALMATWMRSRKSGDDNIRKSAKLACAPEKPIRSSVIRRISARPFTTNAIEL
ncbi:hypothetical protein KCP78_08410 [Salmonella enterica subsp. enterica]|nr:hypothetical protein KCP78_08410 [Salmonella enterica subsp. enterica]